MKRETSQEGEKLEDAATGFEDGGRHHELRNAGTLQKM